MKRTLAFVLIGLFVATVARAAPVPISSDVTKTAGPITTTPPVVTNFASMSGVTTVVTGAGSTNLAYKITNEDPANLIRCEFGTSINGAPKVTPTTVVGMPILAGSTYVELVAPNNRLDCIPAGGSPNITVTVYPK